MKNVLTIAVLSLLVVACSTAGAQNNGMQSGDTQFNKAQNK